MAAGEYPKVYLYRRIVQAKLFIDEHYASPIDLGHIISEASFSRFHFIRIFTRTYGLTPHRYLTRKRLEKTKELLKQGKPVTEACYSVGFESLSSFTALFKKSTGITPSEYRERQLRLTSEKNRQPLRFIPGCFSGK